MASIVNACLRDGRGGSPTAIVQNAGPLTDAERRRIPVQYGTSHAVFITRAAAGHSTVDIRFFTAEGELPACGHGTVAALAFLAGGTAREFTLRAFGRTFTGRTVPEGPHTHAAFDPGRSRSTSPPLPAPTSCSTPSAWPPTGSAQAFGSPRSAGPGCWYR